MKTIKGRCLCLLLLSCLLLCACSSQPLSQPPENSWIIGVPEVQLKDWHITCRHISAVSHRNPNLHYVYHMENGVEQTQWVEESYQQKGVITYGQYSRTLDAVVEQLQSKKFPFTEQDAGCYQILCKRGAKAVVQRLRTILPGVYGDDGLYMGYYRYSLKDGTLQQGQQSISEEITNPLAVLVIVQDVFTPVYGGGYKTHQEAVYIFIEE